MLSNIPSTIFSVSAAIIIINIVTYNKCQYPNVRVGSTEWEIVKSRTHYGPMLSTGTTLGAAGTFFLHLPPSSFVCTPHCLRETQSKNVITNFERTCLNSTANLFTIIIATIIIIASNNGRCRNCRLSRVHGCRSGLQ